MADVQDDPADELEWDERALDAAAEVTPLDADSSAVAPLRASLHVHTARALYKLGRLEDARHQLEAARLAAETLPEGGYARLVRSRIAALGVEMIGQRTLLWQTSFAHRLLVVCHRSRAVACCDWGVGHRSGGCSSARTPKWSLAETPFTAWSRIRTQEGHLEGGAVVVAADRDLLAVVQNDVLQADDVWPVARSTRSEEGCGVKNSFSDGPSGSTSAREEPRSPHDDREHPSRPRRRGWSLLPA